MPKEDSTIRTIRRKKETTLREVVVKRVKLSFEFYGLEAAIKEFNDIKVLFSDLTPEWSDIAGEVLDFFLEKKKEAQEAAGEREQQINQMWADALAKNGIVANQLNLMPGSNPQAPYYSTTHTTGGHKQ
ncbi:hypothetical protein SAMN04487900_12913 [Prevotella communis]|uniref:Uncharacterized protein n=1 Tax=Prevotella communis TaxID=2913614 RepID=A0A1H0KSD6_9BACT|nr:hypothetical protein [Prevotella communis]SDO58691.1 hypothetical protein SAMN04487900_12913 [Prevotella communis]